MRRSVKHIFQGLIGAAIVAGLAVTPALAVEKKDFKVAWSIYVGWMPWGYAAEAESGIVKKWADKYGINRGQTAQRLCRVHQSIHRRRLRRRDHHQYGRPVDPCGRRRRYHGHVVGDFSNGNDAVIMKDKAKLEDIKGQNVNLVEFSVSHYLLARALESIKLQEKDLKVVNTSDADMAAAFKTPEVTAVITWKPIVSTILESSRRQEGVRQLANPRRVTISWWRIPRC